MWILYRNFYCLLSYYPSTTGICLPALPAWDPYLVKNIKALEDVQKFALRICLKLWQESYSSLLDRSGLPMRRRQQIRFSWNLLSSRQHWSEERWGTNTGTQIVSSYNSLMRGQNNMFKNSFMPRTMADWNSLCFDVCTISSISEFKSNIV